jgi:membrane glycosyltransferase
MVEAAFMRRAGWEVWLAWDLEGSYEETPPHLEASLQRDRRWCHGNLQHFWFLCGSGLKTASRLNILLGIMAYLSAPLWLLFLLFSPALFFVDDARAAPMEGGQGTALLAGAVLVLLLAPKILGLSLLLKRPGDLKGCGGRARVAAGVAAETIFSAILAPLLMLFYTRFVCSSLSGAAITWGRQRRRDEGGSSWRELIAAHGGHMILALSWGGAVAWLTPPLLPWLAPVLLGPIFAIPFSRVTASTRLGRRAAERGWFLVPEEARPLTEFRRLSEPFTEPDGLFRATLYSANFGLLQAVLDPYVNAIHVLLLRQRPHVSLRTREYLTALTDRLLWDGPFALTPREKRLLLWDADAMQAAHVKLWGRPSSHLHEWWQAAFRHYNESRVLEVRRSVSS